jgi:Nucleoporin protein Ndc1-Nup
MLASAFGCRIIGRRWGCDTGTHTFSRFYCGPPTGPIQVGRSSRPRGGRAKDRTGQGSKAHSAWKGPDTDWFYPRVLAAARQVGQWWSRPRASRVADSVVPNRESGILIAEGWQACPQCFIIEANRRILVLFRLVLCASLTEDRYGVVQRDIPRILEALLVFLTSHGS